MSILRHLDDRVFPIMLDRHLESSDDFVGDACAKVLRSGEGQAISSPGFGIQSPRRAGSSEGIRPMSGLAQASGAQVRSVFITQGGRLGKAFNAGVAMKAGQVIRIVLERVAEIEKP